MHLLLRENCIFCSILAQPLAVSLQVLGQQQGVALVEGLNDSAPVGAHVNFSNGAKGYVDDVCECCELLVSLCVVASAR
jgi:hypothetical protein